MTWYTLPPASNGFTENDAVATTWRISAGTIVDWTGDDSVGEMLYGSPAEALFGSGGEILRGKDE